jgi:hypothetical protein
MVDGDDTGATAILDAQALHRARRAHDDAALQNSAKQIRCQRGSGSKRRQPCENKRILPAKLAGELRYAVLVQLGKSLLPVLTL